MEFITGVVAWVLSHIPQLLEVIGAFALIATMTPNKTDDEIINKLLKFINFVGANFGKSKNADV